MGHAVVQSNDIKHLLYLLLIRVLGAWSSLWLCCRDPAHMRWSALGVMLLVPVAWGTYRPGDNYMFHVDLAEYFKLRKHNNAAANIFLWFVPVWPWFPMLGLCFCQDLFLWVFLAKEVEMLQRRLVGREVLQYCLAYICKRNLCPCCLCGAWGLSKEATYLGRKVPGMRDLGHLWFHSLEESLTMFWKSSDLHVVSRDCNLFPWLLSPGFCTPSQDGSDFLLCL